MKIGGDRMRLIDADALLMHMADWQLSACSDQYDTIEEAIDAVTSAPTIDAVQVVRCKDCKHYEDDPLGMGFGHCELKKELALAFDRVCADVERKDNE